ncbi:hypothetical protein HLB44_13090 [Aquincola sp. S2]|uniref:Uncharacterized protein n=1 Tax=Pseudaquabacterium terrae TaxID=2732868 RepID=A0ABX2EH13_9BURK|nr:hypothetical protein [Aquabacterium terrae]NRF67922.1 hypothetical protein [Aquabacterium terrae]
MKNISATLLAIAATLAALSGTAQAADVGVSINISQPGVYGRIDIGRFPQPAVVVAQPVLIAPQPVVVHQPVQPVYLWVPPGHRKNWRHHCRAYGACGVPVYFVQDGWYQQHVMVHSDKHHKGKGHGHGHGHGKNKHD